MRKNFHVPLAMHCRWRWIRSTKKNEPSIFCRPCYYYTATSAWTAEESENSVDLIRWCVPIQQNKNARCIQSTARHKLPLLQHKFLNFSSVGHRSWHGRRGKMTNHIFHNWLVCFVCEWMHGAGYSAAAISNRPRSQFVCHLAQSLIISFSLESLSFVRMVSANVRSTNQSIRQRCTTEANTHTLRLGIHKHNGFKWI